MHLNLLRKHDAVRSDSFSAQGAVTYAFVFFASLLLFAGSLVSIFVPGAFAATSIFTQATPTNNQQAACDEQGGMFANLTVYDDEYEEAHEDGEFSADYRIDGGEWIPMESDETDIDYADGTSSQDFYITIADCSPYQDFQEHTFQMRGITPNGSEENEASTFQVGPVGEPEFYMFLEGESEESTIELDSNQDNDVSVSGNAHVFPEGFQFLSGDVYSVQYRLNDEDPWQNTTNINDQGDTTYFGIEWPQGTLNDGVYQIDFQLHEYYSDSTVTASYTLIFGDPELPIVTIEGSDESTFTLTDPGQEIIGEVNVTTGTIEGIGWDLDDGATVTETGTTPWDGDFGGQDYEKWAIYDPVSAYELSNGSYDFTLHVATDTSTYTYDYTMIVDIDAPQTPSISVDQEIGGEITLTEEPLEITGNTTVVDAQIESMRYSIVDEVTDVAIVADDEAFDEDSEDFSINLDSLDLANGTYELSITSVADNAEDTTETYNLIIDLPAPPDAEDPTCGTSWYNQSSPNYNNEFTYTNIQCTDNVGITAAHWRIYHNEDGELIVDDIDAPVSGSYGDQEVTFTFTAAIPAGPNHDGGINIDLVVEDAEGNEVTYTDPIVVDYEDQTAPILSLQLVKPEQLTDTTPTVTGTCSDNTYRETNSHIESIEVNIDGEGYDPIDALDGSYDSNTERFAYTTPELSLGDHVIDVRCTDAAGNIKTTNSDEDLEFTIEAIDENDEPVTEEYVEDFETHDFQDFAGTTLIWGNGKLRLREDISLTRDDLDTSNYENRYTATTSSNNYLIKNGVDSDTTWYVKTQQVWKLDEDNDSVSQFNPSTYSGHGGFGNVEDLQEFNYGGKRYLVVSDLSGLSVFNLTDNTGFRENANGGVGHFIPDVNRGRLGLYVTMLDDGGETTLAYWQLGSGADPFSGDTFTRFTEGASGLSGTSVVRIFESPVANEYYLSIYETGLYRFNDNNTPTNFGDDQSMLVDSPDFPAFDPVFGLTFDPNGKVIFGTSAQEDGELFVIDSDNGTPFTSGDDVIYKLATRSDLGFNDVFGIEYLEGVNGIGDQLFIRMENGNPVYFNFNDTYSDPLDDTFIELVTNDGIRPSVTQFVIGDYNTLYANIDRQGLFKINLDRDWESSGQAIALPPRPSKVLAINNFTADATTTDPITFIPGSNSDLADSGWGGFIQQAQAQSVNITYEVSLDDGVTWEEVSLGELQNIDLEDYRLQFRITMTPIDGSSPVVNTYSLEYGGYPNPEDIGVVTDFEISVSPTSLDVGENFTLEVQAVDILGYLVPDYNGTVTLQMLDNTDTDQSSALSITQISVVDGEGTATGAFVNRAGTYSIIGSNEDADGESNEFTVTADDDDGDDDNDDDDDDDDHDGHDPALSFVSDDYLICQGQTVNLRWTSSHLSSMKLNGETVDVNGSVARTPSTNTTYTLAGKGSHGDLTTALNVTVDPNPATCATALSGVAGEPTPTPLPGESGSNGESNGSNDSDGGVGGPTLDAPNEITVIEGETVTIWWESDADTVTVDYLGGEVGATGSFQFIGRGDQEIIITAYKDGKKTEKRIRVIVRKFPANLGEIIPAQLLPIFAAAIRYGGLSWLALLLVLKILAFFKRKPDGELETSWVSDVIKQLQVALWVISPILLLFSLLAAGMLGGPLFYVVAVLVVIVMLRHFFAWTKTWVNRPVAG